MNYADFFNSSYYAADEDTTAGDIATVDAPLYSYDDPTHIDPVSLVDSDDPMDPAYDDEVGEGADDTNVCPNCGQDPCTCEDDLDPTCEGDDDFEDGGADIVADSEDDEDDDEDDEDDDDDDFEDDELDDPTYEDAYRAGYDAAVSDYDYIPDVDECGVYNNDYDLNMDQ